MTEIALGILAFFVILFIVAAVGGGSDGIDNNSGPGKSC